MTVRLALRLTRWTERYFPSSFVIAVLLTLVVFALGVAVAGKGPLECVRYWGDGFWVLLGFAMQMCLMLLTGSMLADSPLLRRAMDAAAAVPKSPRQTVAAMAAVSMAVSWLHWGLGLVLSAFMARSFARRHPSTDYRLLVTTAYFGLGAIWHAGLSGSATLLMATPKHFLEKDFGIVPMAETTFSAFNLALSAVVFASLVALAWLLHPEREDARPLSHEELAAWAEESKAPLPPAPSAWLRFAERGWFFNAAFGGLGLLWLAQDFSRNGAGLTFDKINFLFFTLAALLHPSPASFLRSAEKGAGYLHGIVVQFPLYAGMYGVIKGSGLDQLIADAFLKVSTAGTFPAIVVWYSGVLNYVMPSGGSKWAVEAPYLLAAAKSLGVPASKTVLAYAWGDMMTDLIQPFFAIPLLAVAKLEFKDILGYATIAFAVNAAIVTAAFLLF